MKWMWRVADNIASMMDKEEPDFHTTPKFLTGDHLFYAFKNYDWDDISSVCDSHPDLLEVIFSNSNTPLHEICSIGESSRPSYPIEFREYFPTALHILIHPTARTI